jgi:hypothetical protein
MPLELPDAKKLKELLKVLRAQGVLQYQTASLTLVLAETLPQPFNKSGAEELMGEMEDSPEAEIERLINYSSKHPAE